MAWQEPKTNWKPADVVTAADLNRIEGNTAEAWAKFDKESGHRHTGEPDDGPKLDPTKSLTYVPVNKAGDTMTGPLTVDGSGVWPKLSPKNADAPPSEYPDGLSMMTVGTTETGWPVGTGAVLTYIGGRGSGQRIWQLIVSKVLGGIWFRTRNNDDTAWEQFYQVWTDKSHGPGATNTTVQQLKALLLPADTRSIVVTQWDAAFPDKPKQIQIKDGSTVVATIDVLARNSEGKATQIRATAGSWSRTWRASWTSGRSWPDSVT